MENTVPELQQTPAAPKKSKKGLIIGIVCAVLVIAIVAGVLIGNSVKKENLYKDAVSYAEDGDIDEAIAIHEQLGDYKDLKTHISDGAVDEFDNLLEKESYKKLLRLYASVANYPDALEEMDSMLTEYVAGLMKDYNTFLMNDLYERALKEETAVALIEQGIVEGTAAWLADNSFSDVIEIYEMFEDNADATAAIEEKLGQRFVELLEAEEYAAETLYYTLKNNEIQLDAVSSAIYDRACSMFEQGEYYTAIDLYEELGEYKDSVQKIEEVRMAIALADLQYYLDEGWYSSARDLMEDYEGDIFDQMLAIYMTYCGDSTVIADLEAAIAARMELENQETPDYQAMLDAEYAFLSKYEDMPFYDETLGDLIDDYLGCLDDQQYYLNWYYDDWYMPYYWGAEDSERYAVLTSLNESYGYAATNTDLQGVLGTADAVALYWDAWYNITYDLMWEMDYAYTNYSENYQYLYYRNDTDYTFMLRVTVVYTDADGNVLSTEEVEYGPVTPDMELEHIMNYPEGTVYFEATKDFYDIYLGEDQIG